jgi:hypothetical protein
MRDFDSQTLPQRVRVDEVPDADTMARRLVRVRRANSPQRRPDLAVLATRLLAAIDLEMIGQHDMRPIGDHETVGRNPLSLEFLDFVDQARRVDHDTGADHADAVGVEDSRGNQVQLEGALRGFDRVTCIAPAIGADHHVGTASERIGQLAFALVAPLSAHDDAGGHDVPPGDVSVSDAHRFVLALDPPCAGKLYPSRAGARLVGREAARTGLARPR